MQGYEAASDNFNRSSTSHFIMPLQVALGFYMVEDSKRRELIIFPTISPLFKARNRSRYSKRVVIPRFANFTTLAWQNIELARR